MLLGSVRLLNPEAVCALFTSKSTKNSQTASTEIFQNENSARVVDLIQIFRLNDLRPPVSSKIGGNIEQPLPFGGF